MSSYTSPKIKLADSALAGKGLIVVEDIEKGEVVIDYSEGIGKHTDFAGADELWSKGIDYDIQVGENNFFIPITEEIEAADYLNHSCEPNCGIKDRYKIVAMRNIKNGEEISFDYAMSESYPYKMKCNCGTKSCRGEITGEDWKLAKLQKMYRGYFQEYLQKKIDATIDV